MTAQRLVLTRVRALKYRMPLRRSYGTARGTTTAGVNFLVQVTGEQDDEQFNGVGECQPRHALTGDGRTDRVAAWAFLCACVDFLDGRTLTFDDPASAIVAVRNLLAELDSLAAEYADDSNRDRPFRGTLLGIEVAVLDVVSRALDLTIAELLGKKRDDIAISISTISSSTGLDKVTGRVTKQNRYPITRVKGIGEIAYDLDLLDRVTRANRSVGWEKPIWIDINEALDLPGGSQLITLIAERMKDGDLPPSIVVEGILPKSQVTELPQLQRQADAETRSWRLRRRKLDLRIMPDEGMWDTTDLARVNEAGGCRALNIKAPKAGGLLASLDLANAAVEADPDIHICIGGMLGTSDITAFALHNLARALPRVDYLTTVPPTNVKERIAEPRAAYRSETSNVIVRQTQPGLGTRLDLTKVMPFVEATYGAVDERPTLKVVDRTQPETGRVVSTLTFAGDTSLGDVHINRTGGDLARRLESEPMSFFESLRPLISDQAALILNLETVLADAPTSPFEGQKRFLGWDSPRRAVGCLRGIGVDAVSLANNHTMDFGPEHLLASRQMLEEAGIQAFGAGATDEAARGPLTLEPHAPHHGRRVHVIAAMEVQAKLRDVYGFYASEDQPGVYAMSVSRVAEHIRDLRSADPGSLIIVFPHWGGNYRWVRDNTKRAAATFVDAGANLIIGHGPHMLQQATFADDHAVAYSVGNFVFNWAGRFSQYEMPPFGLVARVDLAATPRGWDVDLRLYPIVSDNRHTGYRPRPVDEQEFESAWLTLCKMDLDGSFTSRVRTEQDSRGLHLAYSFRSGRERRSVQAEPPRAAKVPVTIQTTPSSDTDALAAFHRGSTTFLLAKAVIDRELPHQLAGIPRRRTPKKLRPVLRFTAGDQDYFVRGGTVIKANPDGSPGMSIDGRAVRLCSRKDITKAILGNAGFSVPSGMSFSRTDLPGAMLYFAAAECALGLCVKPANGNKGQSIFLNLRDRNAFKSAFESVANDYDTILVEEAVPGDVYRFLTVGGKVAAVRRGEPASVTGDGQRTIAQLVETRNDTLRQRGADRHNLLKLSEDELRFLAVGGRAADSILKDGEQVYLSSLSNRHAAAEVIDCTDEMHDSYKRIVEAATSSIPDLVVCGADLMIDDATGPAKAGNHFFIELNTSPGIRGHHAPSSGAPRDIAGKIIDHVVENQP